MNDDQNILNIEKQEAKRDIYNIGYQKAEDIYNVAGDLVILHPITKEPVYIPTIQSVLRKEETSKGDFFKKEPEWVDFEQGFIVERREVNEIKKKLEKEKIQLVLGAPASGKSLVLKNVGFKLINEDKKVYLIELKKHPRDEIKLFFDYIPKVDEESPIFIIEDAHLYISECEGLIRNFKGRGKGKLIIGSREMIEGDPTQSSELERLSKTAMKIRAEDVTEEIIKIFLKKLYSLDEDKIRTVSGRFENFKKDLWYLSWALKAYRPDKDTVEEDTIYEKIKERIKIIKAEDVFLPLSIFYRYEIPIERKFLKKKLGIKDEVIDYLIEHYEIRETEEIRKPAMLSLHHSSLADLYFGTYQNYPSLGEEIKEKILNEIDEKYLEYCLFYQYLITADIGSSVDVAIYLGVERDDKKGGKTLLKNIIGETEIQKTIINGINKEVDIEKVGKCLTVIAEVSKEVAIKLVECTDISALSLKINKEEDIFKIALCVYEIFWVNKDSGLKLVNHIDFDILTSKLNIDCDNLSRGISFFNIVGHS